MTEIRLFTSQTRVDPGRAQLVDPRQGDAAGAALKTAGAALGELVQMSQGQRRVGVMTRSIEELSQLQIQIEGEQDPARISQLVEQGSRAIRERVNRDLSGDSEGQAQIGLRMTESLASLNRFAANRARAAREDAFKAELAGTFTTLANQAAAGGQGVNGEAVRNFQTILDTGVSTGNLTRVEAATLAQRFRGQVESAQVLGMIRTNPGAAVTALADPNRFPSLAPDQRERLIMTATNRQSALASQGYTAALRQEQAERRQREADATAAEKDVVDAVLSGDRAAASSALARLRTSGTGESYRTMANLVEGIRQDIPTTPLMRAAIASRLRDRDNPLTREELGRALERGEVSLEIYRDTLGQLQAREDARFREAEAFVSRALGVLPSSVPGALVEPANRERQRQADEIINALVNARERNPDVNPLDFVRDQLRQRGSPTERLQLERAQNTVNTGVPAELRDPAAFAQVEAQMAAWLAARENRGWFGRTPDPPRLQDGTQITAALFAQWKQRLDALRSAQEAASRARMPGVD